MEGRGRGESETHNGETTTEDAGMGNGGIGKNGIAEERESQRES